MKFGPQTVEIAPEFIPTLSILFRPQSTAHALSGIY